MSETPTSSLQPETQARAAVASAKLRYVADVLKSYGVVISGAAVITPAFTDKPISGIGTGWLIVSFLFVLIGLILTPEV